MRFRSKAKASKTGKAEKIYALSAIESGIRYSGQSLFVLFTSSGLSQNAKFAEKGHLAIFEVTVQSAWINRTLFKRHLDSTLLTVGYCVTTVKRGIGESD